MPPTNYNSYNYQSPIIIFILALGLFVCSYFVIGMVFTPDVDTWIRIICFLLFVLFFSPAVIIGYVFVRNIKPKQIVLEAHRILIPDMFAPKSSTFSYSDINVLKIATDYRTIFSPYGNAICIATEKNGYIRQVFIEQIWMKNRTEFLELFEFLNNKKYEQENNKKQ